MQLLWVTWMKQETVWIGSAFRQFRFVSSVSVVITVVCDNLGVLVV